MIRTVALLLGLLAMVIGALGGVQVEATTQQQPTASETPQRLVVFEIFSRAA